jgi:hypothetical protein
MTVLAVVLAAGTIPAYTQTEMGLRVNIKFPFIFAGKTLPAGTYDIEKSPPNHISLRAAVASKTEAAVLALYITRIAGGETPMALHQVVFDRTGDQCYLSEVWFPGQDGYLVQATKGEHTHIRVIGSVK